MRAKATGWPIGLGFTTMVAGGLLASGPAAAQTPGPVRTAVWASAAIGPTSPYDIGIVGTAAVRHDRLVVRALYASAGEFSGDWFEDLGLLAGVVVTPTSASSQLAISAGVGRATCRHCGFSASQPDPPSATAFLLDVEGRLALTPVFGLAAHVFADFNSSRSFGGVAFGLFVGRL